MSRFKSALFSGFNRRDVVSYITDQAKQKQALNDRAAELEAQLEQTREALDAAREENQALVARVTQAEQAAEAAAARAEKAEETCRGLQKAVRSSLTELNALSGAFDEEATDEAPGETDTEGAAEFPEGPGFPEDVPPDEEEPLEGSGFPEGELSDEEEPLEGPGFPEGNAPEEAPAEEAPEEPAVPAEEAPPVRRRTVEIRRHERI